MRYTFTFIAVLLVSGLCRGQGMDLARDILITFRENMDYDKTIDLCRSAIEEYPDPRIFQGALNYTPYFYLGASYFYKANFDSAHKYLTRSENIEENLLSDERLKQRTSMLSALNRSIEKEQQIDNLESTVNDNNTKIGNLEKEIDRLKTLSPAVNSTPVQPPETLQQIINQEFISAVEFYLQGRTETALRKFVEILKKDNNYTQARLFIDKINQDLAAADRPPVVLDPPVAPSTGPPRIIISRPDNSEFDSTLKAYGVYEDKYIIKATVIDEWGIDSVFFAVNDQTLKDSTGENLVLKPTDQDQKSFTFSLPLELERGKRTIVVINATDIDRDSPKTMTERIAIVRKLKWWERSDVRSTSLASVAFSVLLSLLIIVLRRLKVEREASVPLTDVPNPYEASRPVRGESYMIPVEAQLNDLESSINNNCIALWGERRIGKTSILFQFEDRLKKRLQDPNTSPKYPVYFTLDGRTEADFLSELMTDIYEVLDGYDIASQNNTLQKFWKKKLELSPDENMPLYNKRSFIRELDFVVKEIQKTNKNALIVLLLDEWDNLYAWDHRWLSWMRSTFCQKRLDIRYVSAGVKLRDFDDIPGSQWYNAQINRSVPEMDEQDCQKLITGQHVLKFDEQAVAFILEVSRGRPFLVQLTCSFCFEIARQKGDRNINLPEAEAAFGRAVKSYLSEEGKVKRILREISEEAKQQIIGGSSFPEKIVESVKDELFEFGLCEKAAKGGMLRATPMLIQLLTSKSN